MNRNLIIALLVIGGVSCDGNKGNDLGKELTKEQKTESLESTEVVQEIAPLHSTPESVAHEIFRAANEGDFSTLYMLCDPEGEVDRKSQRLCEVLATPRRAQEDFMNYFKLGKVIGTSVIKGDSATVQIQFGYDGTSEQILNMINREGKWYLSSFQE